MNMYVLTFLLFFQFLCAFDLALETPPQPSSLADSVRTQKPEKVAAANTFFKSADAGQTWQEISETQPENLQEEGFIEIGSAVFNGSSRGLFKSTDHRKTWKQVDNSGWVMKFAASDGVLMATSQKGIIRSTDDGESWETVLSEGGVGIDVEEIQGGFAAITYNTESETRRVRTSYDGGKTWQPIDAGLPASLSITSIVEVGEDFFCGHPTGIFKSSDKGKTWKLLLPSVGSKVFNLSVSGKVIYAVPKDGGC